MCGAGNSVSVTVMSSPKSITSQNMDYVRYHEFCILFFGIFILIEVIQEAFLFGVEAGNLYFLLSF